MVVHVLERERASVANADEDRTDREDDAPAHGLAPPVALVAPPIVGLGSPAKYRDSGIM